MLGGQTTGTSFKPVSKVEIKTSIAPLECILGPKLWLQKLLHIKSWSRKTSFQTGQTSFWQKICSFSFSFLRFFPSCSKYKIHDPKGTKWTPRHSLSLIKVNFFDVCTEGQALRAMIGPTDGPFCRYTRSLWLS